MAKCTVCEKGEAVAEVTTTLRILDADWMKDEWPGFDADVTEKRLACSECFRLFFELGDDLDRLTAGQSLAVGLTKYRERADRGNQ